MLKHTFVHVPRVSRSTELKIWQNNILSWEEFLVKDSPLPDLRTRLIRDHISESLDSLKKKDYSPFTNLPSREHWRLYPELKDKACFLDIETTGLSKHYNSITTIGMFDGSSSKVFVQGEDLGEFPDYIKKFPLIVTFNGRCFDVPFINTKFPDLNLDPFHVDLRFAMRELGYSGGLKSIEKQVGVSRDDELAEVDGYEAVRLWKKYQRGDSSALELLIKYNTADVENLQFLMDLTFDKLKEKNFISLL